VKRILASFETTVVGCLPNGRPQKPS
jgi:hypothetical protein